MCKDNCALIVKRKMSRCLFDGRCDSVGVACDCVDNFIFQPSRMQKRLDSLTLIDIIIFTYLNGRSAADKTILAPPAGYAESSPGRGAVRDLSQPRIFRSRGSAPGQVRDAATGGCRQAAGQPGSQGIRFLAAIVLSGAGRLSTSWSCWLVAAETRAPIRAQAHRRTHAVCAATPGGRAGHFYFSACPTSNAAVRRFGSPPQHRSSTAASKKTPVTPESVSACSPDRRLVAAYEELRCQAIQGGGGPGLALMMSRGLRCWMEAWSQLLTKECSRAQQFDPPESSALSGMRQDLVILLAGMLLHRVSKGIA
jgi:hypothetical protein